MWIPREQWRYAAPAEVREADRRCIEGLGIPGAVLMYNAGRAVYSATGTGTIGVVCGKGNNGGDGYVAAVAAQSGGRPVRVVALAAAGELRGDARLYHDVYVRLGGSVEYAVNEHAAAEAVAALAGCDVLVDAILGTGFSGAPRGAVRAAIEAWPKAYTVAVDVPSGLDALTGATAGPCIRADITITFQAAKSGFTNPAAAEFLGELRVADIGIPECCFDADYSPRSVV